MLAALRIWWMSPADVTNPIPSNQHTITQYIIRQRPRIRYSLNFQDLRQFAPSHPLADDNLFTTSNYPVPASLATPEDETFIRHSSIMLSLLRQQTSTPGTFVSQAAVTRSINPSITQNSTDQRIDSHLHAPTLQKH